VSFLGSEDGEISEEILKKSRGIVVDTATTERISDKRYVLCPELVKIDHHISVDHYGDPSWVVEEKSSSCEMIAEFYYAFRDELKIDTEAATYIYAGMVTDSGRFRFRSVSGDTMRYAGMLLDLGVDTDHLYAHLYMKELHEFKFHGYVLDNIKMTENGVAYVRITSDTRKELGLTYEEASACVSYMDSIKNSLIWIAFIEADDGEIRVRLRSRFVTVNEIAENYRGGGHDCASGATVYNDEEIASLLSDADARLKDYKENNEGWL
jgi:phosphoesterase RecJ-like protein